MLMPSKITNPKDKLRRAGWILLVVLFLITGLGVGVYAFLNNTGGSKSSSNYIQCAKGAKEPNQQPGKNGKVKGAQLADFTPLAGKHVSYLSCTDFKVGSGVTVTSANQTVTVLYVGATTANGTIFDSSYDSGQPLSITLSQVIVGWGNGLLGMKVGGMRRLFIPAQYGYGAQAAPGIPPNSDLVFDIQLISVK